MAVFTVLTITTLYAVTTATTVIAIVTTFTILTACAVTARIVTTEVSHICLHKKSKKHHYIIQIVKNFTRVLNVTCTRMGLIPTVSQTVSANFIGL